MATSELSLEMTTCLALVALFTVLYLPGSTPQPSPHWGLPEVEPLTPTAQTALETASAAYKAQLIHCIESSMEESHPSSSSFLNPRRGAIMTPSVRSGPSWSSLRPLARDMARWDGLSRPLVVDGTRRSRPTDRRSRQLTILHVRPHNVFIRRPTAAV